MASRIRYEDVGDVCVVHFTDSRLTSESDLDKVGTEVNKLVDDLGKRKLLLDFANVTSKSSNMIGREAMLNKRLREMGGKLVLCGISKHIFEAYVILGLDKVLTIVKDEQTGLNSF